MKKLIPFEVPWRVKDAFVVFLGAWIGLPLLTQAIISSLAPAIPAISNFNKLYVGGNIEANFLLSAINAVFAVLLVGWYLKRYHASWKDVGFRKFNFWKALLFMLGVYLAFVIIIALAFALISALAPSFQANQKQVNDFTSPSTAEARRLSLIALAVLPPIVEETVFRGFLFPAMTKKWGVITGAVVSSLLFAAAHLQLNVSIYTFILGLLLCMMYYRFKSIWPGIIFHAINNYIAFLVTIQK